LLNHSKINLNIKDNDGNSALSYAAQYSNCEMLYTLMEHKKITINTQNNMGYTPAMIAAETGNLAAINVFLLNKKVKFNMENEVGETALIIAVEKGQLEIVELLLESQRSDLYSGHGDNNIKLLQCAVNSGRAEIVSLFLGSIIVRNGSFYSTDNISVTSSNNSKLHTLRSKNNLLNDVMNISTPFFTAAERGYLSIIKLFIERKYIDINIKDNLNETALIKATMNGHVRLVDYLLKLPNINVKQWNVEGLTALDIAKKNGNVEIITLIKQYLKKNSSTDITSSNNKLKILRRSSDNLEKELNHGLLKSNSDNKVNSKEMIGIL